ncbi:hypothetical protein BB559_005664 [Furculomyces boomerangus]|uniref:tRNA pseudouridine synthase 1 n=1 Tax=Furculomyces boomerangus TaxID=61424 RepID=A0A2T9Y7D5_9FUNG|nr:hypothetical protein BB559_005664 [Furculomyces boomerangus]
MESSTVANPVIEEPKNSNGNENAEIQKVEESVLEKTSGVEHVYKGQTGADRKDHFIKNSRNNKRNNDQSENKRKRVREESNRDPGTRNEERKPKKNVILLFSYCGTGYQGMQVNPNAKTIEGDLFSSIVKAGGVSEDNSTDQKKVQLQRAARTDKGVHAAGQVVSLKMIIEDPEIVTKINSFLPDQIRVWGYKRVIRSFNPKTLCDSRIYEYLLPTYVFMPPDEETIELISKYSFEKRQSLYMKSNENLQDEDNDEPASSEAPKKEKYVETANSRRSSYRISKELLEQIRTGFGMYVGTHNFLNFTVTKGTNGKNSSRHIKSFTVSDPMIIGDGEWLSLKVHGQSFMLHQIRKMVGLIILLTRSKTPFSIIDKIYKCNRINIPKAPGFGLLLEKPVYESYNDKVKKMPANNPGESRELIVFDEYEKKIEEFKKKFIYDQIFKDELENGHFSQWAEMCDVFPEQYPYLNPEGEIPESAFI